MPSLITKQGKKRYRASVMFQGLRDDKLFPDGTKKSLKEALEWEKQRKAELQQMAEQTNFGFLTVLDWMDGYLDEAESGFTPKTFQEKKSVSDPSRHPALKNSHL